jgi:hypothetical protein
MRPTGRAGGGSPGRGKAAGLLSRIEQDASRAVLDVDADGAGRTTASAVAATLP